MKTVVISISNHPFAEIVWVTTVSPESDLADCILYLKIFYLYTLPWRKQLLHLVLDALANKGLLLQVRLVLDKQRHKPDNPGDNLWIKTFICL